ncbi:MAG: hypothetical protein P8R42_07990 [Candidatus Binatia bacterium]|nr:hypothetical protein [Candidatus Binatia bacterium]
MLEPDSARLVPLVDRYLAESGSSAEREREELLGSLSEHGVDLEAASPDEVAAALEEAIDEDWRTGGSVLIDGWIVSITEAQLVASALAPEPTC